MSRLTCPACSARFRVVLPDPGRVPYGITWWTSHGRYCLIACERCGCQFLAFADRALRPTARGNADVLATAKAYMERAGLPPLAETSRSKLSAREGRRLAKFYELAASSPNDPAVKEAYAAFRTEVREQFVALERAGFRIEPWIQAGQPYANSSEMMRDVREHKHLYFFRTSAGNPSHALLPAEDNERFRAVHDLFGHAMRGNQFGPQGETNALRDHYYMFSRLSRKAMATETIGQNSWFNFSRLNQGRPPAERDFAEQKAVLLKSSLYDHLLLPVIRALSCRHRAAHARRQTA